jgi:hypothetical protein
LYAGEPTEIKDETANDMSQTKKMAEQAQTANIFTFFPIDMSFKYFSISIAMHSLPHWLQ